MTTYRATFNGVGTSSDLPYRSEREDDPIPTASGESTPLFNSFGPKDPSSPELDHALHRLVHAPEGSASVMEAYGQQAEEEAALLSGGEEEEIVVEGEDRATRFVWVLVCAAAISGLLFGASLFAQRAQS